MSTSTSLAAEFEEAIAIDWVNPSLTGRLRERWLRMGCRRLLAQLDKTTDPLTRGELLLRLQRKVYRVMDVREAGYDFDDFDHVFPLMDLICRLGDLVDAENAALRDRL